MLAKVVVGKLSCPIHPHYVEKFLMLPMGNFLLILKHVLSLFVFSQMIDPLHKIQQNIVNKNLETEKL